jgi:hypothetical protein
MTNRPAIARTLSRPGLLEGLVAGSVLLALSGVLMPRIGEQVGESRQLQAQSDLQGIAEGLAAFSRDTLYLPTGVQGRTNVAWLYGPGRIPAGHAFGSGGEARSLDDALLNDAMGGSHWAGPYVQGGLGPDPWGQSYLVNVDGWLTERESALVLSAGPDGIVQTAPDAARPAADDLALVLD